MFKALLVVIAILALIVGLMYLGSSDRSESSLMTGRFNQATTVGDSESKDTSDHEAPTGAAGDSSTAASAVNGVMAGNPTPVVPREIVRLKLLSKPGKIEIPEPTLQWGKETQAEIDAARSKRDPALEYAVLRSEAMSDLVETANTVCSSVQAVPGRRMSDAKRSWEDHNMEILLKARKAHRTQFHFGEEYMLEAIHESNSEKLEPVRLAIPEKRATWCTQAVEDIMSGTLDLEGERKVTSPLSHISL